MFSSSRRPRQQTAHTNPDHPTTRIDTTIAFQVQVAYLRFIRDVHFIGVLLNRTTPHSGRLWYVDSHKWNDHREIEAVQTFLTNEARYAHIPFSWNGYEIVAQASASMPIQRSYRLPHQLPIEAV